MHNTQNYQYMLYFTIRYQEKQLDKMKLLFKNYIYMYTHFLYLVKQQTRWKNPPFFKRIIIIIVF